MQTKIKFVVGVCCSQTETKRLTTLQKNKFTPTGMLPIIRDSFFKKETDSNQIPLPGYLL